MGGVLISFREWLHSYPWKQILLPWNSKLSSHLFQRVASFLQINDVVKQNERYLSSHLFQRVASFLLMLINATPHEINIMFSSLSESGFIPTRSPRRRCLHRFNTVLISFREWLHSYVTTIIILTNSHQTVLISFREWLHSYCMLIKLLQGVFERCSHLFQRVASFLLQPKGYGCWNNVTGVLISFREWLHSYYAEEEKTVTVIVSTKFSSLSESGFIPTGEPCLQAVDD